MINLAGRPESDRQVALELDECGVPIHVDRDAVGEVPTILYGRLPAVSRPHFVFRRAWYYWVVRGEVPLSVAKELYADPVGQKDVRVAGHCACPPPEHPWVRYIGEDGRRITVPSESDQEAFSRYERGESSAIMAQAVERVRHENQFVSTDEEMQALAVDAYVDTYHIDSQKGLNLFVATLRRHGVAKCCCGSTVEHLPCKQAVAGSTPAGSSAPP